jgi:hypothetical protein
LSSREGCKSRRMEKPRFSRGLWVFRCVGLRAAARRFSCAANFLLALGALAVHRPRLVVAHPGSGRGFCVARTRICQEMWVADLTWSWEGKGAFSRAFFGTRVARSLAVQRRSTPLWRGVGCGRAELRVCTDRSNNCRIRLALACRSGRFHRRAETFCVRSTSLTRVAHRWCLRR